MSVSEASIAVEQGKPKAKVFTERDKLVLAFGAAVVLAGSLYLADVVEDNAHAQRLNEERIMRHDYALAAKTATGLAQAGFTNLANVRFTNGKGIVTLSSDPTNPEACKINFDVATTNPTGSVQLELKQTDASGHVYGTAVATNGAAAQEIVQDLCN